MGFFSSVSSFGLFGVSFCTGVRTETKRRQPLDENNIKQKHTSVNEERDLKYELVKRENTDQNYCLPVFVSTTALSLVSCTWYTQVTCLLHFVFPAFPPSCRARGVHRGSGTWHSIDSHNSSDKNEGGCFVGQIRTRRDFGNTDGASLIASFHGRSVFGWDLGRKLIFCRLIFKDAISVLRLTWAMW